MTTADNPRDRTRLGIACLLGAALAAAHVLWLPRITVDDAFISYRYARNFVEGHGLVFNVGERVEGYSNLLWVLLTAAGMKLGFEPLAWTRGMGAICHVGVVITAVFAAHRLTRSAWAAIATGLLLGASTALCSSAMSGLETGLYSLLITAAFAAVGGDRLGLASLMLGLAAITRPEGAGVCVVGLTLLVFDRNAGHRRDLIRLAAPCAAVVIALLVFRLSYYGELLPNSVRAKSAMWPLLRAAHWRAWPGLIFNQEGLAYIGRFAKHTFGWGLVLAVIPLFCAESRRLAGRFLFAAVCMGHLVALYNFGDWMSSFRLLTPYLPAMTILVVWGAAIGLSRLRDRRPLWIFPARCAVAGLLLFCAVGQFQSKLPPASGSPDLELADIIERSNQPNLLATTDVLGRLGYYAPNTAILDMAGLTDVHIARHGEPRPPFGRNDFDYVLSRRPHFIMNNVRTAWNRHLNKPDFANGYWWVDRPAWTFPSAARGKPRFVFVRRGSLLEQELRARYFDASLRDPIELTDGSAVVTNHNCRSSFRY